MKRKTREEILCEYVALRIDEAESKFLHSLEILREVGDTIQRESPSLSRRRACGKILKEMIQQMDLLYRDVGKTDEDKFDGVPLEEVKSHVEDKFFWTK